MKGSHLTGALVTGAVFLLAPLSDGAVLVDYSFTGDTNSSDTDLSSTATAFSNNYPSDSGLSGAGNYFVRVEVTPAAPELTNYFTFGVTPVTGLSLNLTSLSFRLAMVDNSVAAFNGTVFVRSSADGYAADIASFDQSSTSGSTFVPYGPIDLSSPLYQGLSGVTFRFYFYDDTNSMASTSIVHRIDDVIVEGTAVPEPAVAGMLVLMGAAGTLVRRRTI